MDATEANGFFTPLYEDLTSIVGLKKLLAHYTSMEVLERILSNDELWCSNPLHMNDQHEVSFGILNGIDAVRQSDVLKQTLNPHYQMFIQHFDGLADQYTKEHLLDNYVFCMTEHDPHNDDGQLSMWRCYGGAGKGAAIVFDSATMSESPGSPLLIFKVEYGSNAERLSWIQDIISKFAALYAKSNITIEWVTTAAFHLFERLKLFALFTKHSGFREEKEWRGIYLAERDRKALLRPMLGYVNGPRGMEPKLKFKVGAIDGITTPGTTLESTIAKILIGPNASSGLALRTTERMLRQCNKEALIPKLVASTIPLREGWR